MIFYLLLPAGTIAQVDSVMYGIASYYHNKFNGRMTSNGEIFRNDSLTAAHKKLRFGTIVRVTNLTNDSTVIVRINDRLPQNSTRSIDLSQAAAKKLNMMRAGIVKAKIEILPRVQEKKDSLLMPPVQDTVVIANIHKDTLTVDTVSGQIVYSAVYNEGLNELKEYAEDDAIVKQYVFVKNNNHTWYTRKAFQDNKVIYYKGTEEITEEQFRKETGAK